MPLGDADIASGVFFAEFGVPVVYGAQTTRGNFDESGQDSVFDDNKSVSNSAPQVEIAAGAFSPAPKVDDVLTVNGKRYKLRSSSPMDDGATVVLKLRKL